MDDAPLHIGHAQAETPLTSQPNEQVGAQPRPHALMMQDRISITKRRHALGVGGDVNRGQSGVNLSCGGARIS